MDLAQKCPGRTYAARDLTATVVRCPSCGRELELFSDEQGLRCPCGRLVMREALPTCAEWCPSAVECFGLDIDPQGHRRRVERLKADPHAKEHVERICQRIRRKYARAG